MNILQAAFLGVIEGLTEYLPVSSTFHLIWGAKLLGLPQTEFEKLFEVVIQSGAILAVFILFFKIFLSNRELMKKTIVAFLPTAIVGIVLYKVIKNVFFENNVLMLSVFIGVGIIFIFYEWLIKKEKVTLTKDLENITYKEAIIIGLMQSVAVIPGVSRAGAVIIGMMVLKYKRAEAAKFSFLLSVPTLFAAGALDVIKTYKLVFSSSDTVLLLIVGLVVSFIVAYVVVKWFITYLQKHSMALFGWYRIIAGTLLILLGVH